MNIIMITMIVIVRHNDLLRMPICTTADPYVLPTHHLLFISNLYNKVTSMVLVARISRIGHQMFTLGANTPSHYRQVESNC